MMVDRISYDELKSMLPARLLYLFREYQFRHDRNDVYQAIGYRINPMYMDMEMLYQLEEVNPGPDSDW